MCAGREGTTEKGRKEERKEVRKEERKEERKEGRKERRKERRKIFEVKKHFLQSEGHKESWTVSLGVNQREIWEEEDSTSD